jgi:hypothetical protein
VADIKSDAARISLRSSARVSSPRDNAGVKSSDAGFRLEKKVSAVVKRKHHFILPCQGPNHKLAENFQTAPGQEIPSANA